uniref:Uncharacterized protein n=1 Tax=Amphora coffeiformis TaxID=265554 RepID=A0A7S3L1J2_9STRA|mmetsp:Transcript_7121/g.14057  ORF Transcript_7121/g.14057 Transcript_7121/m.14057 type:complete len:379 (+) Transcript_7121:132-1268(+)
MDLSTLPTALSFLPWDETQRQNCTAQGLITNNTDHVWLSCTSYIAHGRLQYDSSSSSSFSSSVAAPTGLVIDKINYNALDGPRRVTGQQYGHISDGDYFPAKSVVSNNSTTTTTGELWFGIEGTSMPRVLPGAIARYNAETLEFIDIHPHPYLRTMPWLLVDPARQRAISCNWTDNYNQFQVFDTQTMTWVVDQNLTLTNPPAEFQATGVPYIQGATKAPTLLKEDEFILQLDDAPSTLLLVSFHSSNDNGDASLSSTSLQVQSSWQTGLGHEREGIGMTGGHILSLGNRKTTVPWATAESEAQIVVLHVLPSLVESGVPFGFGILVGVGLVVFFRILCWCFCCRCCRSKSKKDHTEAELTTLNNPLHEDDGTEDELI